MKHKHIIIVYFIILLACAGCKDSTKKNVTKAPNVPVVEVQKIPSGTITHKIKLTGEVHPSATVILTPKVSGRLERLSIKVDDNKYEPVVEGTHVREGQQIAVIDEATYTAQKQQAESALSAAKVRYEDAEREARRITALFNAGAVTEQIRDKALTTRALCEVELQQAEIALKLATINYNESRPVAPIDGIVTKKHIDEGNIVTPATPIVTIENLTVVKVLASIPERYIPYIIPGKTRVEIASDVLAGNVLSNVVSKIYPSVDRATRTGTLEILVDNRDYRLRSGNFVTLQVELSKVENVPVIPISAIIRQGEQNLVFVVEGTKAKQRTVQLGLREGELCEVKEGVKKDELLVIQGQRDLRDGDTVSVFRKEKK
jgi:RND family efflux transporter MFP subunit